MPLKCIDHQALGIAILAINLILIAYFGKPPGARLRNLFRRVR